jgi:hypothetical protein
MENQELTLTEEELKKKIDEAVKKATDELSTKLAKEHNEQMAQQRIKAKDDQDKAVAKAVAEANLSAEEKAKKEIEEQRKLEQEELAQLRLEKKINDRAKKLAENELPDFFKNDTRLLNAEEDKVDEDTPYGVCLFNIANSKINMLRDYKIQDKSSRVLYIDDYIYTIGDNGTIKAIHLE